MSQSVSDSVLDQAVSIGCTADGQLVLLLGHHALQVHSSLTEINKTDGSIAQEMCTDGK